MNILPEFPFVPSLLLLFPLPKSGENVLEARHSSAKTSSFLLPNIPTLHSLTRQTIFYKTIFIELEIENQRS